MVTREVSDHFEQSAQGIYGQALGERVGRVYMWDDSLSRWSEQCGDGHP